MGFFRHDAFDKAVGAVWKCGAVLAHGAVHEPQVLKKKELPIGIEPIERFPTRVLLKRLCDVENVILRHSSRRARSTGMKPIRISSCRQLKLCISHNPRLVLFERPILSQAGRANLSEKYQRLSSNWWRNPGT